MFARFKYCACFITGMVVMWLTAAVTENTEPSLTAKLRTTERTIPTTRQPNPNPIHSQEVHTSKEDALVNTPPKPIPTRSPPTTVDPRPAQTQFEPIYADVELTVADAPPSAELTDATDPSPADREQQQALEARWQQQSVDAEWSRKTEELALHKLSEVGIDGITLLQNSCKTSLCRIQIHYGDAASERLLLAALANGEQPEWLSELQAFGEPDFNGGKQVTYYLGRKSQLLP